MRRSHSPQVRLPAAIAAGELLTLLDGENDWDWSFGGKTTVTVIRATARIVVVRIESVDPTVREGRVGWDHQPSPGQLVLLRLEKCASSWTVMKPSETFEADCTVAWFTDKGIATNPYSNYRLPWGDLPRELSAWATSLVPPRWNDGSSHKSRW